MSWREERDALIAQTLAFVQSVTGQPTDFSELPVPLSGATMQAIAPAVAVPAEPAAPPVNAAAIQVVRAEAAMIDAAMGLVSAHAPPGPLSDQADSAPFSQLAKPATPGFSGEHFTSITAELGLQRDMQSEIKARVASFRAHQERVSRERQEYFSATLARLRDSLNGSSGSKA